MINQIKSNRREEGTISLIGKRGGKTVRQDGHEFKCTEIIFPGDQRTVLSGSE